MASSNKEDSSIINTTTKSSSNQSNAIREDSQQQQQHTEYNTETDSIQEYEPFLNDEHIEYRTETDSNSRLSNVGDKVVETVKVKFCTKSFIVLYVLFGI